MSVEKLKETRAVGPVSHPLPELWRGGPLSVEHDLHGLSQAALFGLVFPRTQLTLFTHITCLASVAT